MGGLNDFSHILTLPGFLSRCKNNDFQIHQRTPQKTVILFKKCYQKLFINLIMTERLGYTDTECNVTIHAYTCIDFKCEKSETVFEKAIEIT